MFALDILLGLACVFWLFQSAVYVRNVRHLRALRDTDASSDRSWPSLSIVIPARDEADGLEQALRSRLADDYPEFEIVFVDDRSSDPTLDVVTALAAEDSRIRVIHIDTLPPGWLGKVHALNVGLREATGEWVLFSDADVHVEPGTMKRAVAHCTEGALDFLAVIPEYRTHSWLVDTLWATFLRAFGIMIDADRVRDPSSATAMGSGAFNLVRREAFDRTPGFEWLRLETADDMALGMMMKQAGGRCDMIDGRGSASVLIYRDLRGFFRGTEKNAGSLLGPSAYAVAAAMLAWLALEWSPLLAFATGVLAGPTWLAALGFAATLAATALNVSALRTNTGRFAPALAWPLGSLLFAAGITRAAWVARRRRGIRWRETFYPSSDILAGRRFRFVRSREDEITRHAG